MNFDSEIVNVSDEKDVQTPQMPIRLERQILVFGDDNANIETTPFVNYDSFKTRACMLPSVQGEPIKKN
jgi:hypothetical protein